MTLAHAFRSTVEQHPDRVAVRTKDDEVSLTWSELRDRVDALAGGLAALGVRRGDTVALMLTNRPEFHIADLAVMTLGATPFSIYGTFTREQIASGQVRLPPPEAISRRLIEHWLAHAG